MFTAMYNRLVLNGKATKETSNKSSAHARPLENVELIKRNLFMILSQLNQVNGLSVSGLSNNPFTTVASTREGIWKCIFALEKYLNSLIDQNSVKDVCKRISNNYYGKKLEQSQLQSKTKLNMNRINKKIKNQIKSFHCLFTWNLESSSSNKDIITQIKKKYGDYNLNISIPVFAFKRYVLNIIIAYELFQNGEMDKAKLLIVYIGKWLEELDNTNDEFYLLIKDGLKHVLTTTFIYMKPTTNLIFTDIQQIINSIVPFSDMNQQSKAAVYAVQAAVLIEYSKNKNDTQKAIECIQIACDLNSTNAYWFYLHSIVLRAHRHFIHTYRSSPTNSEKKAIQEAIALSTNQNFSIMYQNIILFNDTILNNFHSRINKKDEFLNDKHLCDSQKFMKMIKKFLSKEPEDPLLIINCARILLVFPGIIQNLNLGKELLIKGLQMASNDLVVLKAATKVITRCKNIFEINENSLTICKSSEDQSCMIKQANLSEHLKKAVEIHNNGKDPVPYLLNVLIDLDGETQWKMFAQICSYTILFNNNLIDGIKYFMLLVDAEQNKIINSNLILHHYSSFIAKSKKFNLAVLISKKIKLALTDDTLCDKNYYNIILTKLNYLYIIESESTSSLEIIVTEPKKTLFNIPLQNVTCDNDVNIVEISSNLCDASDDENMNHNDCCCTIM